MARYWVMAAIVWASAAAVGQTVTYSVVPVAPTFHPDIFTWDILVSVTPNDDWTASGIKATTANGAKWFYDLSQAPDPNFPTAPGTGVPNKFSTFVNTPRSQFANGRFTTPTDFAGAYNPSAPHPIVTATELNAAWLELPPVTTSLDTNAAIVRLSLDTRNTFYAGWHIEVGTFGIIRVASVEIATGTVINEGVLSVMRFDLWVTYPPEPGSAMLWSAGLVWMRSFRRPAPRAIAKCGRSARENRGPRRETSRPAVRPDRLRGD